MLALKKRNRFKGAAMNNSKILSMDDLDEPLRGMAFDVEPWALKTPELRLAAVQRSGRALMKKGEVDFKCRG
jgi:hypothetical protein